MLPLRYIAWWRPSVAARRMRETGDPLAVIAREEGYGSQFAFKREFGTAPGVFRRQAADVARGRAEAGARTPG